MPITRRRTATKLLRLHPDELARIAAHAETCGLNAARFIREAALGPMPKARRHVDTDRLLRALARLGRQLEQAMRHVRSSGDAKLAEQVGNVMDGHRTLVAQVVALRAPNGLAGITTTPHITGASGRSALRRPSAAEPAAVSGDQLTIDFDLAGPRRVNATASRGAPGTRELAVDAEMREQR